MLSGCNISWMCDWPHESLLDVSTLQCLSLFSVSTLVCWVVVISAGCVTGHRSLFLVSVHSNVCLCFSQYPGMLSGCYISWMCDWPQESLLGVSTLQCLPLFSVSILVCWVVVISAGCVTGHRSPYLVSVHSNVVFVFSQYPGMLRGCYISWMCDWPQESLLGVSTLQCLSLFSVSILVCWVVVISAGCVTGHRSLYLVSVHSNVYLCFQSVSWFII